MFWDSRIGPHSAAPSIPLRLFIHPTTRRFLRPFPEDLPSFPRGSKEAIYAGSSIRASENAYLLGDPVNKAAWDVLPIAQPKSTTNWSRGMTSVTLSAGSTGETLSGVPSASALSNASVPAVFRPVTVNESTS